jgi:hypothetical protein
MVEAEAKEEAVEKVEVVAMVVEVAASKVQ